MGLGEFMAGKGESVAHIPHLAMVLPDMGHPICG
jgi:hypothetical protein